MWPQRSRGVAAGAARGATTRAGPVVCRYRCTARMYRVPTTPAGPRAGDASPLPLVRGRPTAEPRVGIEPTTYALREHVGVRRDLRRCRRTRVIRRRSRGHAASATRPGAKPQNTCTQQLLLVSTIGSVAWQRDSAATYGPIRSSSATCRPAWPRDRPGFFDSLHHDGEHAPERRAGPSRLASLLRPGEGDLGSGVLHRLAQLHRGAGCDARLKPGHPERRPQMLGHCGQFYV